jgi:catechol 2,3-dioxygenase-like lactoylglutathione lyase family enzyme
MISHLTVGSNDVARSRRFYDATMDALGLARVHEARDAVAYARIPRSFPWIWVMPPFDGLPATRGNGTHIAFLAGNDKHVADFHAAALANGGSDEGAPGLRPHYAADYFAAYVRDPDGNKLQAVHFGDGRRAKDSNEILSHVTLGTNDLARAKAFYDKVLATLGLGRLEDEDDEASGYGVADTQVPWVYAHRPFDGGPASRANGTHVAFLAPSREAVDAFHAAALALGGSDEGAPGPRPQYSENYYGAYVRDPDGNKLQAVCYRPE